MTPMALTMLVHYVIDTVNDLGGYTTTLRLQKFLYLIDLEHYRRRRALLTGLTWRFHHYGPYAPELGDVGARLGLSVEEEPFESESGRTGRVFHAVSEPATPYGLSFSDKALVDGLLGIWANEDTDTLLRYVYATEPIRLGTRYRELDWSLVPHGTRFARIEVPINETLRARIRASLQERAYADDPDTVEMDTEVNEVLRAGLDALDAHESSPVVHIERVDAPSPEAIATLPPSDP